MEKIAQNIQQVPWNTLKNKKRIMENNLLSQRNQVLVTEKRGAIRKWQQTRTKAVKNIFKNILNNLIHKAHRSDT